MRLRPSALPPCLGLALQPHSSAGGCSALPGAPSRCFSLLQAQPAASPALAPGLGADWVRPRLPSGTWKRPAPCGKGRKECKAEETPLHPLNIPFPTQPGTF